MKRFKKLGLTTLETRRLRRDLIEVTIYFLVDQNPTSTCQLKLHKISMH